MAKKTRRRTDRFHSRDREKDLEFIRRQQRKWHIGERKTNWDSLADTQIRCIVERSVTELGPSNRSGAKVSTYKIGPYRQTLTDVARSTNRLHI